MIVSKRDYIEYYKADLEYTGLSDNIRTRLIDRRPAFYKLLRKTEYYTNCRKDLFGQLYGKVLRYKYRKICDKYMWTIPINVFGKGLQIVHVGPIVVNGSAKIGDYARVHVGVNIGQAYAKGKDGAPQIGNYCYFGPGAKLFGPIKIGDKVVVGANSIVNESFSSNCTIAGVPAKVISYNNSDKYIMNQTKKVGE